MNKKLKEHYMGEDAQAENPLETLVGVVEGCRPVKVKRKDK